MTKLQRLLKWPRLALARALYHVGDFTYHRIYEPYVSKREDKFYQNPANDDRIAWLSALTLWFYFKPIMASCWLDEPYFQEAQTSKQKGD